MKRVETVTIKVTKQDFYNGYRDVALDPNNGITHCPLARAFARSKKKKIGSFKAGITLIWNYYGSYNVVKEQEATCILIANSFDYGRPYPGNLPVELTFKLLK